MHAGMPIWIDTNYGKDWRIIFQIINSLIESWGYAWPALTVILTKGSVTLSYSCNTFSCTYNNLHHKVKTQKERTGKINFALAF